MEILLAPCVSIRIPNFFVESKLVGQAAALCIPRDGLRRFYARSKGSYQSSVNIAWFGLFLGCLCLFLATQLLPLSSGNGHLEIWLSAVVFLSQVLKITNRFLNNCWNLKSRRGAFKR